MCKLSLFYILAFPENENVTPFDQAHIHPKMVGKDDLARVAAVLIRKIWRNSKFDLCKPLGRARPIPSAQMALRITRVVFNAGHLGGTVGGGAGSALGFVTRLYVILAHQRNDELFVSLSLTSPTYCGVTMVPSGRSAVINSFFGSDQAQRFSTSSDPLNNESKSNFILKVVSISDRTGLYQPAQTNHGPRPGCSIAATHQQAVQLRASGGKEMRMH
ncbi:hypothetical protein LA080_011483 [Diaporthe eres]|nr:hypothetical protein LA080_011483 [Diaporthe eres]